jgi:hypothetical protein
MRIAISDHQTSDDDGKPLPHDHPGGGGPPPPRAHHRPVAGPLWRGRHVRGVCALGFRRAPAAAAAAARAAERRSAMRCQLHGRRPGAAGARLAHDMRNDRQLQPGAGGGRAPGGAVFGADVSRPAPPVLRQLHRRGRVLQRPLCERGHVHRPHSRV